MRRFPRPAVGLTLLLLGSCICPVQGASVDEEDGRPVFHWQGGGLARLCVTDVGVACPAGENDTMPAGTHAEWFVSARGSACFPNGIQPPVVYGEDRAGNCMSDETAQNGGTAGGEPLTSGKTYRVGLVGFGGAPAYQTFVAP
jgi:hypothetical protein